MGRIETSVADANLSAPYSLHMVLLFIWLLFLLPASLAFQLRYGRQGSMYGIYMQWFANLLALVGFFVWRSGVEDSDPSTTTSLRTAPEGIVIGLLTLVSVADLARLACCATRSGSRVSYVVDYFSSPTQRVALWFLVVFLVLLLCLIAFDGLVGSCGGKIVISHKKGYEIFGAVPEDLCASHFSYLFLCAVGYMGGVAYHVLAETVLRRHGSTQQPQARGSQSDTNAQIFPLLHSLEYIALCIVGTIVLIIRAAIVSSHSTYGSDASPLDAFFGNSANISDGSVWGTICVAATIMVAVGFLGAVSVLGNCCSLLQRGALPTIMVVTGCMFLAAGGSIGNTYFGHSVTKDLQAATIQSSALLSGGLALILFGLVRVAMIYMWSRQWSSAALHYVLSICAVAINSFAGFCLLAQPATAQMMSRELGVGDWVAMLIVLLISIILHALCRAILAMLADMPASQDGVQMTTAGARASESTAAPKSRVGRGGRFFSSRKPHHGRGARYDRVASTDDIETGDFQFDAEEDTL